MIIHITITHDPEGDALLPYLARADYGDIEVRDTCADHAAKGARGVALCALGQWGDPPFVVKFTTEDLTEAVYGLDEQP